MNLKKYRSGFFSLTYFRYKVPAAIILITVFLLRCTSALYKPVNDDAARAGKNLGALLAGRKLYIDKCASCHNLYLPGNYSATQWKKILDDMKDESRLTPEQMSQIFDYLESGSRKE